MAARWGDSNTSNGPVAPASAPRGLDAATPSLLVAEPTDFERMKFANILATVSTVEDIHLPPFLTGQSDTPWWNPHLNPVLRGVQPATDNRLGALRMQGAVPGGLGDLDLCKLWVAVARAGGVNNITSPDQWRIIASRISLLLPAEPWPGYAESPVIQLSQIYKLLLRPVEDYMERTKLSALGWNPPTEMGLSYLNPDAPEGIAKAPAPINFTQQLSQKTNLQSRLLAPGATVTSEGMERAANPNQATSGHVMNENRAKRKRDDSSDGESKRIKAWAGGGNNPEGFADLPDIKLKIDFSVLDSIYASQLSLDHPNSDTEARGGWPLRSPTPEMNTIQMHDDSPDPLYIDHPSSPISDYSNLDSPDLGSQLNTTSVITGGTMSAASVVEHLAKHQCPEVTGLLDLEKCGKDPVFGGGFGDVYQGHLRNGRRVAIKCVRVFVSSHDELHKMLKRSARELSVWSKCRHANVIELLGVAQFRDQIATVSPWMENGSLTDYLARNRSVDRCRLCVEVAEGLNYLHEIGMVHGDVKAANVLVSDHGTAKLADFGDTILQEYTLEFTQTTKRNKTSLRWTAPELISEDSSGISKESDVYALGMTILEIITGKVPFAGKTDHAVMVAVTRRNETPQRPDGFIPAESTNGDALWALLERCWAFRPQERPRVSEIVNNMRPMTQEGLLRRAL
ncbi:kinase-like protein [Ceratobasidium sp. AG-I]|nr:kinase-like protein [Ceratobasidium sp. AG-I]